MLKPAGRALARGLALATAILIASCGESSAPPPNIVLILVDQLRADAVERSMPRLQALGERGVQFTHMRSAAPWTYPSVMSMFSGLYPQQHGADGSPDKRKLLSPFSPELPTLPLLLREHYYTAGFVTNPFLQTWNPLYRGFDHYAIDEFIGDQGAKMGDGDAVWTDTMFGDSVNAAVKRHFDAREYSASSEPEFTYVHYIDVHGPWDGAPFDTGGADHTQTEDRAYGIAAGYADERIAELYDYFLERYSGDVVFVVTSDHGQELGDDLAGSRKNLPRLRKATVHDFNTRIPFLLLPSERIVEARVIDAACSNVDISPTLLEWVGSSSPIETPGRSLLALIRGESEGEPARVIYSVRNAFGQHNDCIVVDEQKFMRIFGSAEDQPIREASFDLASDPNERRPSSADSAEWRPMLKRAASTHGVEYPKSFEAPDEELKSKLEDIGYLGDD